MEQKLKDALAEGRAVSPPLLARALSISLVCIYGGIKRGEIRSIRIGKAVRIPAAEARRLLGLNEAA